MVVFMGTNISSPFSATLNIDGCFSFFSSFFSLRRCEIYNLFSVLFPGAGGTTLFFCDFKKTKRSGQITATSPQKVAFWKGNPLFHGNLG